MYLGKVHIALRISHVATKTALAISRGSAATSHQKLLATAHREQLAETQGRDSFTPTSVTELDPPQIGIEAYLGPVRAW